jgi:hypothetical protein
MTLIKRLKKRALLFQKMLMHDTRGKVINFYFKFHFREEEKTT